jgi:hypothetical protein
MHEKPVRTCIYNLGLAAFVFYTVRDHSPFVMTPFSEPRNQAERPKKLPKLLNQN